MGITPPEFLASLRSAHAQDHLAEGISRPHPYLASVSHTDAVNRGDGQGCDRQFHCRRIKTFPSTSASICVRRKQSRAS